MWKENEYDMIRKSAKSGGSDTRPVFGTVNFRRLGGRANIRQLVVFCIPAFTSSIGTSYSIIRGATYKVRNAQNQAGQMALAK